MNRGRAWLTWSPFERGTRQQLALNLLILLVVMTIVQACFGDLSVVSWFGGLTGIAVVAAVLGVPIYRRSRRAGAD